VGSGGIVIAPSLPHGDSDPSIKHHRGVHPLRTQHLATAALALALLGSTACGGAPQGNPLAAPPASVLPASTSSRVTVIVMENKEAPDVVGSASSPYVTALAHRYAIATRSYAIRHRSLPNYLALTSGSTQGMTSDCTDCHVAANTRAAS
jgi:phosphatidylinositol-3-phosphatase